MIDDHNEKSRPTYRKVKDLAVKQGHLVTSDGVIKDRWLRVGSLMEGSDGKQFILLDRSFNPAGVPFHEDYMNSSTVLISLMETMGGGWATSGRTPISRASSGMDSDDDDIPF